jgi:hypothetical protein
MTLTHAPLTLDATDRWTTDYYDPSKLKYADRMVFSGAMHGGDLRPGAENVGKVSIQQTRSAVGRRAVRPRKFAFQRPQGDSANVQVKSHPQRNSQT